MRISTASHNASRSPNTASTRPMLVGCSETPTRVWSGGRHNAPEREISWLTKLAARTRLSSTHMYPVRAAGTPEAPVTPGRARDLALLGLPALPVAVRV